MKVIPLHLGNENIIFNNIVVKCHQMALNHTTFDHDFKPFYMEK